MTRRSVAGAVSAALLGGTIGYGVAASRTGVHHEQGVECLSAQGAISCELEDWTVSVPRDVTWSDQGGTHTGDRPACLPATGRGREEPVELAWVPVAVDGMRWRQVVWVGC